MSTRGELDDPGGDATYGFETLAIHAGQEADPTTGAVVPPIHPASTFRQDGVGGLRGGYEYGRSANPTRTALEECLAALEGGTRGLAFASGMAAEDTLLRTVCRPGDHVVIPDDAYGGTYRLVAKIAAPWGLEWSAADLTDPTAARMAVRPGQTKIIWVESPTNPLLGIVDLAAMSALAREVGALLVVDNTFASPYLQQPIAHGADIVVHSTTKYVGGHSDVVGGALIVVDDALGEATRLPPERHGSGSRPVRRLVDAARRQDARRSDGPAQRQRRARGRVAGLTPARDRRALPGAARAPRARPCGQADAPVRRHGVVPR